MCTTLFGDRLSKISLYDLRKIDKSIIDFVDKDKIVVAENWEEAYSEADVFITCTVSVAPYIDKPPKSGSLQLNCIAPGLQDRYIRLCEEQYYSG